MTIILSRGAERLTVTATARQYEELREKLREVGIEVRPANERPCFNCGRLPSEGHTAICLTRW